LNFVTNATYHALSRQRLYEQVAEQIEQIIIDGALIERTCSEIGGPGAQVIGSH
jgi:hypothetical protein